MKNVNFDSNQCVKIENKEQFNEIYHVFRSAKNGISLEDWIKDIYRGYPSFPIYLEHTNSVYGSSIGFTHSPYNTWTKEPFEVLSFEQATHSFYPCG